MTDYRLKENREEYFSKLYGVNLEHGVMPGLVYLYMPKLAEHFGWDAEQKLWFAFLNGLTQNPITSLRLFGQLPEVPPAGAALSGFDAWFNDNWASLQWDTDRRYQKKDTLQAVKVYAELVAEHGSQVSMLTNKTYAELWDLVYNRYYSFGRLSSFSYLEYVYLNGFGTDCDNLLFGDKSGSKSHRNGAMFLLGKDEFVWDKRLDNGFDGSYDDLKRIGRWLEAWADGWIATYSFNNSEHKHAGKFTFESNLCTFKNHFFSRRYPGVYADMAWERILKAEAAGVDCSLFKDIRAAYLPNWLRDETKNNRLSINEKGAIFTQTGQPYNGEHFL